MRAARLFGLIISTGSRFSGAAKFHPKADSCMCPSGGAHAATVVTRERDASLRVSVSNAASFAASSAAIGPTLASRNPSDILAVSSCPVVPPRAPAWSRCVGTKPWPPARPVAMRKSEVATIVAFHNR
eukprot:scaffold65513_cov64-Phaeocystis_antarctica.AAC.12